jgi:hypothetical protein
MIETIDMCAETDSLSTAARKAVVDGNDKKPICDHTSEVPLHSKSLLEDDEEDEEEEVALSRNPSMEDGRADYGDGFRASDNDFAKHWENVGNTSFNCSQAAMPMCQGQFAEQIDFMTVRYYIALEVV